MTLKKHKDFLSYTLLALATLLFSFLVFFPAKVAAQSCSELSGADVQACQSRIDNCDNTLQGSDARFRGGCYASVYEDFDFSGSADASRGSNLSGDCSGLTLTKDNCGIVGYIVTFINVLSAAVGVVIVIMIAVGGIQYSASRDDPQMVNVAKQRIQNAVLALVFYLFAFAFLQWLVPGGIF